VIEQFHLRNRFHTAHFIQRTSQGHLYIRKSFEVDVPRISVLCWKFSTTKNV